MATIDYDEIPPTAPVTTFIRRHSAVTRITHWINVLCLSLLLMSGLQIFNAHPSLYWGQYGADADQRQKIVERSQSRAFLHHRPRRRARVRRRLTAETPTPAHSSSPR